MKTALELIANERQRQITQEEYTLEHDDAVNNHYQLSQAASLLCYIDPEELSADIEDHDLEIYDFRHTCPVQWDGNNFNSMMNQSYEDRLIKAGALILAEIERLQRKEGKEA